MAKKEYIERDAVIEQIRVIYCGKCNSYNGVRCRACEFDDAMSLFEDAPAADVVEVRHGEWIDKEYFGIEVPVCSVCECESTNYEYHTFCPNCGAKMDGGETE